MMTSPRASPIARFRPEEAPRSGLSTTRSRPSLRQYRASVARVASSLWPSATITSRSMPPTCCPSTDSRNLGIAPASFRHGTTIETLVAVMASACTLLDRDRRPVGASREFADDRAELSVRSPGNAVDALEHDLDVAHPLAQPLPDASGGLGAEAVGRDVPDRDPAQRLLDDLRFPDRDGTFEDRIEPADRPALRAVEHVVDAPFDGADDGKEAPARAALARRAHPPPVPDLVAHERHVRVQESRTHELSRLAGPSRLGAVEHFDETDFRPEVHPAARTLARARYDFRHPVSLAHRTVECRPHGFALVIAERLGVGQDEPQLELGAPGKLDLLRDLVERRGVAVEVVDAIVPHRRHVGRNGRRREMVGRQVELIHRAVPHPVGRFPPGRWNYHLAAQDPPAIRARETMPPPAARFDQGVPAPHRRAAQ